MAMYAPTTGSARFLARPTWLGATWPCLPPPIIGSTIARATPLLVITADINASLAKALPNLLGQARATIGDRQVTIVFDRGGVESEVVPAA